MNHKMLNARQRGEETEKAFSNQHMSIYTDLILAVHNYVRVRVIVQMELTDLEVKSLHSYKLK